MDELPRREAGTHLPPEVYKVANIDPNRWYVDERTLIVIIDGLRRWQITGPVVK
ncbi:MAG: hypothetical protein QOC94_2118 [Actinoplanes sp.]|jgi:hypothetical protein|nr:hypothetical protein [Actinoplanes sp.]